MGKHVIKKINGHNNFKYDASSDRVAKQNGIKCLDVEEFLNIMHILDCHHIDYIMTHDYQFIIIREENGY